MEYLNQTKPYTFTQSLFNRIKTYSTFIPAYVALLAVSGSIVIDMPRTDKIQPQTKAYPKITQAQFHYTELQAYAASLMNRNLFTTSNQPNGEFDPCDSLKKVEERNPDIQPDTTDRYNGRMRAALISPNLIRDDELISLINKMASKDENTGFLFYESAAEINEEATVPAYILSVEGNSKASDSALVTLMSYFPGGYDGSGTHIKFEPFWTVNQSTVKNTTNKIQAIMKNEEHAGVDDISSLYVPPVSESEYTLNPNVIKYNTYTEAVDAVRKATGGFTPPCPPPNTGAENP